jgi:CheY-like chemotaxis protein
VKGFSGPSGSNSRTCGIDTRTGSRHAGGLPSSDNSPGSRAVRVLIVDDSDAFRETARELLEHRGYVVAGQAGSVREAIAVAAARTPDAALVDIGLPDAPGTDLATFLRVHHPGLAVLLTSADAGYDPKALVEQSGAAGFVLKRQLGEVDLGVFWPFRSSQDR